MPFHTKVFLTVSIFMLTVGVTLPLASLTSMGFILQRDCENPNYVPKDRARHDHFCEQFGWN
jgi:hypothetical protein